MKCMAIIVAYNCYSFDQEFRGKIFGEFSKSEKKRKTSDGDDANADNKEQGKAQKKTASPAVSKQTEYFDILDSSEREKNVDPDLKDDNFSVVASIIIAIVLLPEPSLDKSLIMHGGGVVEETVGTPSCVAFSPAEHHETIALPALGSKSSSVFHSQLTT
ncbi:hypothetical protein D8674_012949 [Pyrus ussuriensis x Pyrus communis]|uniref:Uncharacterized protein n=1 Tax=Pyrus ussuriensis x Pyrus communis TaxID=2448454 RepID=A0A5N5GV79_9ROSA|nr:hypothetical protein D8674_012949 [Pyrus ussuriensis x Pyrus communis]